VRRVVEANMPGHEPTVRYVRRTVAEDGDALRLKAASDAATWFAHLERARDAAFATIEAWGCRAPGASYDRHLEAARRRRVAEARDRCGNLVPAPGARAGGRVRAHRGVGLPGARRVVRPAPGGGPAPARGRGRGSPRTRRRPGVCRMAGRVRGAALGRARTLRAALAHGAGGRGDRGGARGAGRAGPGTGPEPAALGVARLQPRRRARLLRRCTTSGRLKPEKPSRHPHRIARATGGRPDETRVTARYFEPGDVASRGARELQPAPRLSRPQTSFEIREPRRVGWADAGARGQDCSPWRALSSRSRHVTKRSPRCRSTARADPRPAGRMVCSSVMRRWPIR